MNEKQLNAKIATLKPCDFFTLTETESGKVTVERSSNGKRVRYVRHNANGFEVFMSHPFAY